MNRLKSLFIAIYPLYLLIASGYSVFQLSTQGLNYIWLGALLTTLPMLLFFSRVMIFQDVPRTSNRLPLVTLVSIIGLFLALNYYLKLDLESQHKSYTAFLTAMMGYLLFIVYNYWYSSYSKRNNDHFKTGQTLEKFPIIDVDGNTLSSEIFKGSAAVLVFYRGNWCPLCMAQIKEIAEKYRELSKLGARVVLISPQPESHTSKLANKFDVKMEFYTDKNNQAAKILGIEIENGLPTGMQVLGYDSDTVMPTVIITDKNGKIIYNDATKNYRIRPDPEEFIKILENAEI